MSLEVAHSGDDRRRPVRPLIGVLRSPPRDDRYGRAKRLARVLLRSIVVLARLRTLRSHLVVKVAAVAEVRKGGS